jgi:TPR repeat protein
LAHATGGRALAWAHMVRALQSGAAMTTWDRIGMTTVTCAASLMLACGGGTVGQDAAAKILEHEPSDQVHVSVATNLSEPLIVDWRGADRSELESVARRGAAIVRYEGNAVKLLANCAVSRKYRWTSTPRRDDHLIIRDVDSLHATMPLGAAQLEGELEKSGELDVDTTTVGRWQLDYPGVREDELEGDCAGATHAVLAITAGAFKLYAKASADRTASGLRAEGGAGRPFAQDVLNADGVEASCKKAAPTDLIPRDGCGAMIQIAVELIAEGVPCPPGTRWRGNPEGGCFGVVSCPEDTIRVDGSCAQTGMTSPVSVCSDGDVAACAVQCESGTADACAEMGVRFADGHGVQKDPAIAFAKTRRACDLGQVQACSDLAAFYAIGFGVPRDAARAVTTWQTACTAGSTRACDALGWQYANGTGIPRDPSKAVSLWRRACNAGFAIACRELGLVYQTGKGAARDLPQSNGLFKRACDGGDPRGCAAYGAELRDGEGTAKDGKAAFEWSLRACKMGSSQGCSSAGLAYLEGAGAPRDATQGLFDVRRGCNGGDAVGCRLAGTVYQGRYGMAANPKKAIALLKRACAMGDSLACRTLQATPKPNEFIEGIE